MTSVVLGALRNAEWEGLKLGNQLVGITAGPGGRQWWLNSSGGCRDVDTLQTDLDTSARFLHGPEGKTEIRRK